MACVAVTPAAADPPAGASAADDRCPVGDAAACTSCRPSIVSPSGHTYLVGRLVGIGSFSVVRCVTDSATGKAWACKTIGLGSSHACSSTGKEADPSVQTSTVDSVRREIAMLSRCQRHQGVIQLRETFALNGAVCIITELVAGVELLELVASPTPIGEKGAREIMRQLLHILRHMHTLDVAHRDIKLENLLLAPNPDGSATVKLIDFGLADHTDTSCGGRSLTEVCGTLHFVAPEVLARNPDGYGKECDVWSAGVTLFALLCGEYPFGGSHDNDPSTTAQRVKAADYALDSPLWLSVSEDAKNLLRMMLEPNPFLRVTAEEALQHPWFFSSAVLLPA